MATIPIYRQQTEVSGVPNLGRVDGGVSLSAAAAPSEALAQAGGALQRYAEEKRDEFDTLRAEEAFNKLRERQMELMLDPEKGFAAKKSKDAARQGFTEEYGQQFKKANDEIAKSLQTERQKALYQRRAAGAELEFKNGLMRHVLAESNRYADEVVDGVLRVESNRAIAEWNNPYTIQASLDRIDANITMRAKREGLAADATDALLRDARSKVHTGVIASALEAGNIGYADQYLKLNGSQMNAVDALKVQGMVKKEADTKFALGTATAVVQQFQQQAEPGEFGRLAQLVEHQESRGNQAAVSSAGAVGVMQVMKATGPEAAKLAGLPWDENRWKNDANYNRAIGQAYLADLLRTFGGDPALALAAYNAGPGRVQSALKKHGPSGWLDAMPKETQDYVAAIVPKFVGGGAVTARPTLEQVHAAVRARVGDSNPERLKLAIDESTRQWRDADAARKQREDEATGEAFRLLEANGGRWDALPPSLKARVPGDKLGGLREYAGKVSKGDPIKTDWDVYYTLRSDQATLAKANLLAFKDRLGDDEFKELSRQQQEARAGTGAQSQVQTVTQRMGMRLAEMSVDPTPKPGSEDSRKVAQVYSLLDKQVRQAELALGRKLKPEEMDAQVDRLFTTVEVKGALWGTSKRRAFEMTGTEQIVVPDADRKQITSALQASKQPVTEEHILFFYKFAKGLQ